MFISQKSQFQGVTYLIKNNWQLFTPKKYNFAIFEGQNYLIGQQIINTKLSFDSFSLSFDPI